MMHATATKTTANRESTPAEALPATTPVPTALGQVPLWSQRLLPIQTSLKINAPGDKYEQEADRVADQVMRMAEPKMQRKSCACGRPIGSDGMCAECKQKNLGIQRMASGDAPQTTAPPIVHQVLQQPGSPLDRATRDFMEARFGQDFGQVRLHMGTRAAESARAVNALAYTVGNNIVLGAGHYAAGRNCGQTLLAHELAHVVQQTGSGGLASLPVRHAGSAVKVMRSVDPEPPGSEEFLQERPPTFTEVIVGSWGQSFPAQLVAQERLDTSFPTPDLSLAVELATALRSPVVIMREYDSLWIYGLGWEGLSAHFSRFTNASTILFLASPENLEAGVYSVSNVIGRAEVEAFVTEDGGVLLPPGAGQWFLHTGGEFEETLVSAGQNAAAFLGGLGKGLADANFAGLAERLQSMAELNTVFPLPFVVGGLYGVANEIVDFIKLLDPRQWLAMEAAAQQTVLLLIDPDGEDLAASLGEQIGREQAGSMDKLLEKHIVTFAYEIGKLVGPTVVELVLAFLGFEVGPLTLLAKGVDLLKKAPRLTGVLAHATDVFASAPDIPGLPRRHVDTPQPPHVGDEVTGPIAGGDLGTPSVRTPSARTSPTMPVEVHIGNEVHKLSIVEKDGRRFVQLCSNGCGELAEKISRVLEEFRGNENTREKLNKLWERLDDLNKNENLDVQEQFEQIQKEFQELARLDQEVAFAIMEVDLTVSRSHPDVDLDDEGEYDPEFEQDALERFLPRPDDPKSLIIWLVARRLMERVKKGEGVPYDIYLDGKPSRLRSPDENYPDLDWETGFRYYAVVVWLKDGQHIQYSVNYFPVEKVVGTIKVEKGPPR